MAIHPTAVIDRHAEIDSSVEIGPYAIIEGPVKIGAGTRLYPHTYLTGWTTIGERCEIHPFSVVGHTPQDFHHSGERSYCRIGNDVIIRENSSIHRGTQPESETVIGDECFLLNSSHVGHNCVLKRGVKLLPFGAVGGHAEIDDGAILSAGALVHQFVRIGHLAYVAANARVTMDIPPFMMCYGESVIIQHNVIGMQRAGYGPDATFEIRKAYRTLYRSGLLMPKAIAELEAAVKTEAGHRLVAFLKGETKRGISGGPKGSGRAAGRTDE